MGELIHKLGIDWKLLLAQAVNFIVLLFVLKKFLYQPILTLLAERRKAVEEAAKNAERIKQELDAIEERRTQELERARKDADGIVTEARQAAKERGDELMKAAESRVEGLIADAKRRIGEEKTKMLDEAGREVKELVFLVAEQVLKEKMPEKAHERFVDAAVEAARKGR